MSIVVDWPADLIDAPDELVPETKPQLQEDLWHYRFPWVKTAVDASPYDDGLMVDNQTRHTWMLWHRYRALDPIAPETQRKYRITKAGRLTARQYPPPPAADHLVLDLSPVVSSVAIVDLSGGEGFFGFRASSILPLESGETVSGELPITRAIEDLELSAKTENALKRAGITTVGELAGLELKDFATLPGLGKTERQELFRWLIAHKLV